MNIGLKCQTSSRSLKQFKVQKFWILCSVEIIKESEYLQVLKFWNILSLEEIPKQVKCLECIFSRYTEDYINHSKAQCLEGYVSYYYPFHLLVLAYIRSMLHVVH